MAGRAAAAEQYAERRRQEHLEGLLGLAEQALAAGRLMAPASDNAFVWYKQALQLDQHSERAHRGMHAINAQYIALAKESFGHGRRAHAELMLERAQRVATTPAQAQALRQQFPAGPVVVPDNEVALNIDDLASRNEAVLAVLAEVAVRAKEAGSRLTIKARSDAEGRWIYKQMRQAVQGYRLRGNISLAKKPKVVLIDLGR